MQYLFFFPRSSKPSQPDPAAAHPSTAQPPDAIAPPVLCQLPQPQHSEWPTQPHPRPSVRPGRRAHYTRVSAAAGQLGAQQQRPTGDQVSGHFLHTTNLYKQEMNND